MFATPQVNQVGTKLTVSHGDDSGLIVSFYTHAEHQVAKSEAEGRPIYEDKPYIKIMYAGDRNRVTDRRVDFKGKNGNIPDPQRFPVQWAQYQSGEAQVEEGTPIEEWTLISKSQALMLKGVNIRTVENLAAVTDVNLDGLGHGGRTLRDQAQSWIEQAKDGAELTKLVKENEELRTDLSATQEQVKALSEQVKQLTKRRPGRPRKDANTA